MNKIVLKHSFGIFEYEESEFCFHKFFEDNRKHQQTVTQSKMSTKLYNYKFKLFENEDSEFSFYALAESEEEAKNLILQKTENELYKSELQKKFESATLKATVYEKNEVFVQHTGQLKLFSH
jgi:hypothetical protein